VQTTWHVGRFLATLVGGKNRLCRARVDLFQIDLRQIGDHRRMLDGHADQVTALVEIDLHVLGNFPRFFDKGIGELQQRRIGVPEILDVHTLNLRSKNAFVDGLAVREQDDAEVSRFVWNVYPAPYPAISLKGFRHGIAGSPAGSSPPEFSHDPVVHEDT